MSLFPSLDFSTFLTRLLNISKRPEIEPAATDASSEMLESMATDALGEIFGRLSLKETANASRVCRQWNVLLQPEVHLCKSLYMLIMPPLQFQTYGYGRAPDISTRQHIYTLKCTDVACVQKEAAVADFTMRDNWEKKDIDRGSYAPDEIQYPASVVTLRTKPLSFKYLLAIKKITTHINEILAERKKSIDALPSF